VDGKHSPFNFLEYILTEKKKSEAARRTTSNNDQGKKKKKGKRSNGCQRKDGALKRERG